MGTFDMKETMPFWYEGILGPFGMNVDQARYYESRLDPFSMKHTVPFWYDSRLGPYGMKIDQAILV